MTFEELLKARTNGLPEIIADNPKGGWTSGKVTVIKDTEGYKGCAVRLLGMTYDSWFYAMPGTDKRSRYMTELRLKQL